VSERLTLVQIVRVPAHGVAAFRRYESLVLPLLSRHGGLLERRLRAADGLTEVHILSFPSRDAFDAYMRDPDRQRHLALKDESAASAELLEVTDVPSDENG
jgi:hypothetical protein